MLRYGQNKKLKEDTAYFTGEMEDVIEQVSEARDLGVTMSDNAKFEEQIENICKKSRQQAGWIFITFFSRNMNFMRKMFNR